MKQESKKAAQKKNDMIDKNLKKDLVDIYSNIKLRPGQQVIVILTGSDGKFVSISNGTDSQVRHNLLNVAKSIPHSN